MTTVPVARRRARSRLLVVLLYTLRSCVPARRWALIVAASASAVFLGVLSRAAEVDADEAFANIAAEGILGLVVPIAALVIGDAVLGAEIRSGSLLFTWMSSTPRGQIVAGRWLGGSIVALVTITVACPLAAFAAGSPVAAGPIAVAAAVESTAYVAVFIAIGCLTTRAAVWSLAVVFLVERLLGAALTGIAQWSPTWEGRAIFIGLLDDPPRRLVRSGIPAGTDAVARLALVTVIALVLAAWRMRHLRLSGASD